MEEVKRGVVKGKREGEVRRKKKGVIRVGLTPM